MRISINRTKSVVSAMAALALVLTAGVQQSRAVSVAAGAQYTTQPTITGGSFNDTRQKPQTQGNTGFSVQGPGDFNFTADGTSSTVTIDYQVDLTIPFLQAGDYVLGAGIVGDFGTTVTGHIISLTQYTTDNSVVGFSGSDVHLGAPNSGDPAVPLIPGFTLVASDFGTSNPFFLPGTSSIDLRQIGTISFSGLQAGDVVNVQFPNDTDLAPSPEPATLTLGGLSAVGLLGCGWLRRRKSVAVGVRGA
jgi:hypothetical protein